MKSRIVIAVFSLVALLAASSPAAEQNRHICIIRPHNLTGESEYDWLGHFIADSLEKNLSILPQAQVSRAELQEQTAPPQGDEGAARALCGAAKSVNAEIAVGGDYAMEGKKLAVNINFFEVASERPMGGASFTTSIPELYSRLDDLSVSLAGATGMSYSEAQEARLRLIPASSEEAIQLYGKALMQKATSSARAQLLQQALSVENNFTDALSALALHYYAAGKSAKAQEAFDRLARIQPDYPNIYYNLGLVLNSRMHYSRAIEMYQKALRQESNDPDVWNNIGIVYYQMGMYGEAKDAFKRAVEIEPNQTTARANLEKLERRLQGGLTEQPVRPSVKLKEYIETGAALYASGDYSKALEYFAKALQLQPDDFKANNNIALTYMKMGDIDSAKEHFQRALKADPTAIDVTENLVYLETLKPGKPAQAPATATARSSGGSAALRAAGKAHLSRQSYSEAEKAFTQALEQTPDDAESLHGLGLAYLAQKEYGKAREQFEKALSLDPANNEAQKRLQDIAFILKTGSSQPALQLSITPEMEARGYFVQANELYQAGDYERAVGEYLRALDLAPADVEILNNLGAAYCAAGRPDQAKLFFEKASSIDSKNETVSKNLESLALMENSSKKEPFSLIEIHSGGGEEGAPPPAPEKPQEDMVEAPSPKPEPEPPPDAVKEAMPSDTPQIAAAPREAAHLPGPDDARRQPEPIAPPENIKKEIPIPSSPAIQVVPPEQSSRDHFNMGVFKESEGDMEGALAHYREAVLLEPANAIAQYNLGNIYFRLGAFDSAIECYRAALKADSTFSRSYNNIGVAYYKMGRIEDAKEAWRRALKADPALESARENLMKYGGGI